jgi:hypothetical protein
MDYGGSKLWIVLNPIQTRLLNEKLKIITGFHCANLLCNKEYFIYPALLHAWDLKFKIVIQKEGDLIVTTAGSAHLVCNLDFSLSKASSFL